MNATEQAVLGARLDHALRLAGIRVERGSYVGGNLQRYERVDGASLLARLMSVTGWRIIQEHPQDADVIPLRPGVEL